MAKVTFHYSGELPAHHDFVNPVTGQRDSFELTPSFSLDEDSPAADRALVLVDEGRLSLAPPKSAKKNEEN